MVSRTVVGLVGVSSFEAKTMIQASFGGVRRVSKTSFLSIGSRAIRYCVYLTKALEPFSCAIGSVEGTVNRFSKFES